MMVFAARPNVLLLDEPTNDLDLQTLSALEMLLQQYEGVVVTVSHDRYFMDRVAQHLLVFEGDGRVSNFEGTFSEFLRKQKQKQQQQLQQKKLQQQQLQQPQEQQQQPQKAPPPQKVKPLSSFDLKRLQQLEQDIEDLGIRQEELEKLLEEDTEVGYSVVMERSEELTNLITELDSKTEKWMLLAERAEATS